MLRFLLFTLVIRWRSSGHTCNIDFQFLRLCYPFKSVNYETIRERLWLISKDDEIFNLLGKEIVSMFQVEFLKNFWNWLWKILSFAIRSPKTMYPWRVWTVLVLCVCFYSKFRRIDPANSGPRGLQILNSVCSRMTYEFVKLYQRIVVWEEKNLRQIFKVKIRISRKHGLAFSV